MTNPDPDPHAELSALVGGLEAELERARRRGERRTVAPTAPQAPHARAQAPVAARVESQPNVAGRAPRAAETRATETTPPRRARSEVAAAPRTDDPRVAASPPGDPGLPAALAPGCADLDALRAGVAACRACSLCETRTQTVFADGTGRTRVMFIGEAPGADEDAQGVPFVGRAGQLLTDIITKGMGLAREDVYIANVLKCRPPDNRDPEPREKALCTPWLDRQIELLDPEVLIPLGKHASQHVLGVQDSMGRMRGRVHEVGGRKVVPTYHPAFLLRSPHMKKDCWQDIQVAMGLLRLGG